VALASMTGFARASGQDGAFAWTWEAKSVNGRSLEVRCRVPPGMDAVEASARLKAGEKFSRGSLTLGLHVTRQPGQGRLSINRDVLAQVMNALREIEAREDLAAARLDGLLRLPGVVELVDDETDADRERREQAVIATLVETIDILAQSRRSEGADEIDAHAKAAATLAAAQPEALRRRLRDQVAQLVEARVGVPEERLAQEAALLATKADVREELDRLAVHVAEVRSLLKAGGPVGRKLSFLAQELHREANTLTAKSTDVELTRRGLDLKVAIDQFREQVQNVE
jgi:uncharacterized protein (TIGR00255 family)